MADYIDRKALLDRICGNIIVTHRPGEPSLEIRGANKVINFIEEAPTIEAEPMRHGKWKVLKNYPWKLQSMFCCSECGKFEHGYAYEHEGFNYCPNCGAKMRGENDGKAD